MLYLVTISFLCQRMPRTNSLFKHITCSSKILQESNQNRKSSSSFVKRLTTLLQEPVRAFSTDNHKEEFSNDITEVIEEERYIHKTEVERFIIECMMKVGTEEGRAKMLASNLSEADYSGHFSHGLNRLSVYVKDCEGKLCKPNNDPIILKKGSVTAWVDGNSGLGVVVATFCMKLAIEMAKQYGISWIAAKGSNHFGICQWYVKIRNGRYFQTSLYFSTLGIKLYLDIVYLL